VGDLRTIRDTLDRVGLRFRLLTAAGVIAALAAAVLLALALEVTLDQLFTLPRWLRILALMGGVAATGTLGAHLLRGPLSGRVNDLYLARSIEARYPHLKSGLITYIQLSSDTEEPAALRELVGERVVEDLGSVRPEIVVPSRPVRRKALFLAGALAFGLVVFAVSPSGFWLSFRRSLLPIRNLTETQIAQVVPGSAATYKGKDLEIAARVTGKLPSAVQLWVTRGSAEPVKYDLPPRGEGWYRCILPAVTEGFTYSFTANDDASDEYRIRIAEVPRLRNLAATLRFPKYTGFPTKTQDSGNLDAIEGTEVTLEGTATRPLRSAALALKGGKIAPLMVLGDRFTVRFPLTETFEYAVELVDKDGTADPEPSKFRAVVRKDAPPQVTITLPGKNVELSDPIPVRLGYRIVDDFGITQVKLATKVNGKASKVLTLPVPKERMSVADATLDLKALGVGPGDYVEYVLSATDNKEPEPQTGQSAAYIITIQSTLPLLTFSDAHPDVRVEKYRDPWDRKGSVESKSDRLRADDRSKENPAAQEPSRRDQHRKDIAKIEEKKPDPKKLDPASEEARKAEPEGGREDALSKLLEEKKDLIDRLLAQAGGQDGAGQESRKGRDGAAEKSGDAKDGVGDAKDGSDKPGAANDSAGREAPEGKGETAREGTAKRGSQPGTARDGKNATRGGGTEGGEGEAAGEHGEDGQPGDGSGETAKADGSGRQPGAKSGRPGKGGKSGKAGRSGGGGEGDDGDSGEGDEGSDDDEDYDLADLFPFNNPGGT
jgi:hypothetical protein